MGRQKKTLRLYNAFIDSFNRDGANTLRAYFYQILSSGLVKENEYKSVAYAKKTGLDDKILTNEMFLDRSRQSYGDNVWDFFSEFVKVLPYSF